jgi:hypothetical protein
MLTYDKDIRQCKYCQHVHYLDTPFGETWRCLIKHHKASGIDAYILCCTDYKMPIFTIFEKIMLKIKGIKMIQKEPMFKMKCKYVDKCSDPTCAHNTEHDFNEGCNHFCHYSLGERTCEWLNWSFAGWIQIQKKRILKLIGVIK